MTEGSEQTMLGDDGQDPTVDRYPKIQEALSVLQRGGTLPDVPIERIELTCLANGEYNLRWWEARAEEPDFVNVPPA
jgi:hypothetical protein